MSYTRTFKNLQDETLAWLAEAGDTDGTQLLVQQAIRAAHEKRLTEERWAFMLSRPKTFSTVVNQQFYTLDPDLHRIMYVKNLTTQEFLIEHVDQNVIQAGYDWSVDTDSATRYSLRGHAAVQNQPASPSVVTVASSNTGDNGMSSVTVDGDTTSGRQSETILCNASGTILFTEVLKVTKSSGWVGTMTLSAGATTLLTLGPTIYGQSYRLFYLLAKPNAPEVLEYAFYRQPSPLVADNDIPDYPSPYEELLVWEALTDLGTYNNYDPNMVAYWVSKKNQLLLSMGQAMNEGQSINQSPIYTTYIPR